jgi:hypothetical protein
MEKAIVLKFIQQNKNQMRTDDLNSFLYSNEYNKLENAESKRILFYMKIILNSTKDYKTLGLINKELSLIIESIHRNANLRNIHECYEISICNYLEKILLLIKDNNYLCDCDYISDVNNFVEIMSIIIYSDSISKIDIVKYLEKIMKQLQNNKNKIAYEFVQRYDRYLIKLNNIIESNNFCNYNNTSHYPTFNNEF